MIFTSAVSALLALLNSLFNVFHLPIVNVLPFGIDSIFVSGMGNVYYLIQLIPPFGIILEGFIWVLGWKMILFFLRMFHIVA